MFGFLEGERGSSANIKALAKLITMVNTPVKWMSLLIVNGFLIMMSADLIWKSSLET